MIPKLIRLAGQRLSLCALLFGIVFTTFSTFRFQVWNHRDVFQWDPASYYWYLPALFVHNDLGLDFVEEKETYYNNGHKYFSERAENGARVNRYTMGTALMQAPFFLFTLSWDHLRGIPVDEFAVRYEITVSVAALFYFIAALLLLRNILLRWFSESTTAILLLVLSLGTNLLHYITMEAGMSHVYSFFLFTVFIHFTLRWHDFPNGKTSFFIGLTLGFIVLVRPTNLVVFLFFLLFRVESFSQLSEKFISFFRKQNIALTLLIAGGFLIAVSPQIVYWKWLTGSWLYYGYGEERFFFGNPHILEGLFSYRKGWLVYTPVFFLSLLGFAYLFRKHRDFGWAVPVFFVVNVYIVFSWWSWWYAGSFGQRVMIDSLPILILPMGVLLDQLQKTGRRLLSGIAWLWVVMCILLNQIQTRQYRAGLIHWDSMTREAYWAIFLRSEAPEEYEKLLRSPDNEKALRGEDE